MGIVLWPQCTSWDDLLEAAVTADKLGFDSLWTWDHLLSIDGAPDRQVFESWSTLSAVASATTRIRLGSLCTSIPLRNPGLLAKQAATVDHISHGRLTLGLGAGWFEEEATRHGISFEKSAIDRGARLMEATQVIRSLLDGDPTSFNGSYYRIAETQHTPSPVQERLPILIGGAGPKTSLPAVAALADIWNVEGTPQEIAAKDKVLRKMCEEIGRADKEIERTYGYRVIIRDDEDEARDVWEGQAKRNRMSPETVWGGPPPSWFGPPSTIAAGMLEYAALGYKNVLIEIAPPFDNQTMERLMSDVVPLLSRG